MEAKLGQSLADGGRGLFAERNPNPLADNLGQLPQAAVLLLEQGQNFFGGQGAVLLPCLGINRQAIVRLRGGRRANGLRLRRGLRSRRRLTGPCFFDRRELEDSGQDARKDRLEACSTPAQSKSRRSDGVGVRDAVKLAHRLPRGEGSRSAASMSVRRPRTRLKPFANEDRETGRGRHY